MKRWLGLLILLVILGGFFFFTTTGQKTLQQTSEIAENDDAGGLLDRLHPLSIASLRAGDYPGSEITIEQELAPGSNYHRYLTSYQSEGLKIYALLTVPMGEKPTTGWPVIVFNHGYIPPAEYRTTERYIAYTDAFSRNGYILFRPDYRGHGDSEGEAAGGYGSNAYTIDVLNALESVKKYPDSDPDRIGMWGHSMGGHITLRSMVARDDIRAGVIWAGVVASYPDLITNWRRRRSGISTPSTTQNRRGWRDVLQQEFGTPESNPSFWNAISATTFLGDISGPVQLHHGTADASVPVSFSRNLEKALQERRKTVEYYEYEGDDHNIASNLGVALQRSVAFFDKHVKGSS